MTLLAFRTHFLPVYYWDVLPMTLWCVTDPVGALVWNVGRLENFANGRQRWFNLLAQNSARLKGLIPVLIFASGLTHQVFPDWYTCHVTTVHVVLKLSEPEL